MIKTELTDDQKDKRTLIESWNKVLFFLQKIKEVQTKHTCVIQEQEKDKYGDYGSAICVICKRNFGWYCPKNDTHICDYGDGGAYDDFCKNCVDPDERK